MSPQAARTGRPLPRLESPASRALHAVLDAVRQQRSSYLRLRVVAVRFLKWVWLWKMQHAVADMLFAVRPQWSCKTRLSGVLT